MCHRTGLSLNSWLLTTWWIQMLPLERLKKNKQLLSHAGCVPPPKHTHTHSYTWTTLAASHVSTHFFSIYNPWNKEVVRTASAAAVCACRKGRIRVWRDNLGSSFLPLEPLTKLTLACWSPPRFAAVKPDYDHPLCPQMYTLLGYFTPFLTLIYQKATTDQDESPQTCRCCSSRRCW